MTQQRDFKKLVRERIAKTGERYTTARAHVLAADAPAPEPVPGLIAGYERLGGGDVAALAHALAFAGVTRGGRPYTEALVAGLCGGVGFLYAVFEYKGYPPMLTIGCRSNTMSDKFIAQGLGRSGADFTVKETSAPATARKHLEAALDAGQPALCTVDIASLPYSGMPREWQGMGPHVVAAVGRDGDDVWLDDRAARPIRISMKDLTYARGRYRKGKHRLATLAGPKPGFDLAAAVREAVGLTVHCFHESPFKGFAGNFGFAGMEKMQRLLTDAKDPKGWPRQFKPGRDACTGLHRVYECLQHDYTSPGASRPAYAEFLSEAAGITKDARFQEAAAKFRESGKLWEGMAAAISGCPDKSLQRLCEITDSRAELLDTEGAAAGPKLAALWKERSEAAGESKLSEEVRDSLCADMAEKLGRIIAIERDAVEQLRELAG